MAGGTVRINNVEDCRPRNEDRGQPECPGYHRVGVERDLHAVGNHTYALVASHPDRPQLQGSHLYHVAVYGHEGLYNRRGQDLEPLGPRLEEVA